MTPVPVRLTAAVASLAALSVAVGASLTVVSTGTGPVGAVAASLGLVIVAQLARLKVRAGAGQAAFAWGEAAIVVLCVNLPPAMIPLVVLAGAAVSHTVLRAVDARAGRVRSLRDLLYTVAALTVAGGLAAVTTALVAPVHDAPLTPRGVLALSAGALVYCLVSIGLTAAHVAATRGGRPVAVALDLLRAKLLMVVGNIAVGLVIVWACLTDALLLLLLPPVLWLLQQLYASRIGDREERRTWHEFAEATRDLNRLDVRGTAEAGIDGARRLFGVTAARLVLADGTVFGTRDPLTGGTTSAAGNGHGATSADRGGRGALTGGDGRGTGHADGTGRGTGLTGGGGHGAGHGAGLTDGPGHGADHGAGRGPGRGAGLTDGAGHGADHGAGRGPGRGAGLTDGAGHGSGHGPGHGAGRGVGPADGAGYGPGRGAGLTDGAGHGPGHGAGRGVGPADGAGYGPGRGAGLTDGAGHGAGRGVGPADGAGHGGGRGAGSSGTVVHPLAVGAVAVGELHLAGLGRLRPRNQRMLDAYGDALAAALHDAISQDELRSMSERTTYDAVRDALTGLFNRAALLSRGNAMLRRLGVDDPVAMLLLDVNDFKEVNNALGHAAGDEVLRVIAGRVAEAGNAGDLLARLGGDEFALLITDLDTGGADLALAAAVERARKLGAQIAVPMRIDGVLLSKEPSIGVVVAAAGEVDLTELLRRADIAMYQAKRAVQPVAWYDAGRDDASTDRLALLAELREALNADEQLSVELQPAVSLAPGAQQITGVEALVRWKHPRRGRLAPDQFLPVVEASELMGPLTRWVLDRAIGLASSWRRAGLAVPVSVNISARSLLERQLPEAIGELLARHRLPAELLVLEITETVMLSKSPVIDDVLGRIRRLGVQLAVDDFGTGFSSFTVLTRLPVQEVKIDREFVAQMIDSPKAEAIVRATVELGLRLKLRVVAEGVENPDQRAALAALGCTSAQGFLFHPPLPADRLAAVLRERRQVQRRHLRAEGAS
ncbi:bifunctional diguanylate cyclase/phosphodiesterase [Dactylosporangium sp. NPDC005555]|uniref:putative bifunctional diguanylate cyclase/phosphodiesterase n=1 Tax=Dactylosporangium sp. NPDC005555 TaxID=3154889 RepID=UPI0033AF3DA6